ncbi:MAG TPA: hypothetical protein VIJ93_09755 [bacterium]
MEQEFDLKEIRLSPASAAKWRAITTAATDTIRMLGEIRAKPVAVPNGRAMVNGDGTLTVSIRVPDVLGISVRIPVGQWGYRR